MKCKTNHKYTVTLDCCEITMCVECGEEINIE